MAKNDQTAGIRFEVDYNNLYREEGITDLKSASIRKMTPIKADGSDDGSRRTLFFGQAELISPQGPIPVQAELNADNLEDAIKVLPAAMEKAAEEVRDNYNKMIEQQQMAQKAQQAQQEQKSKIIQSSD